MEKIKSLLARYAEWKYINHMRFILLIIAFPLVSMGNFSFWEGGLIVLSAILMHPHKKREATKKIDSFFEVMAFLCGIYGVFIIVVTFVLWL